MAKSSLIAASAVEAGDNFFNTDSTAAGTERRAGARICADGYQPNIVGSNQDPCVFDGPFHAYCRIDSKRSDNCVKGTKLPLSHVASEGDVVIYGKFEPRGQGPTTMVWVDTVLVVDRFKRWPTSTRTPGVSCGNLDCLHPKPRRSGELPQLQFGVGVWGPGRSAPVACYFDIHAAKRHFGKPNWVCVIGESATVEQELICLRRVLLDHIDGGSRRPGGEWL